MLWVILGCGVLLLLVPPLVAVAEAWTLREQARDPGFWSFARLVAGSCRVPWSRRGSPVVGFPLPVGVGRGRAIFSPTRRAWVTEVRAHLPSNFGFAARICSPPAAPARWRAPGLKPVVLYSEETEHLVGCSLEATDERLMRWLLRHAETRRRIDGLLEETGARAVEILLAGSVVIIRGQAARGWTAGLAVEHLGPSLVEALRSLSLDLHDLACALVDAGDEAVVAQPCPGCGARLGADPWVCPGCATRQHRGCREMLGGCSEVTCAHAPDVFPERRAEARGAQASG